MTKLYTDEEFEKSKSGDKLKLECEDCHVIFIKEKRVINYGIKKYQGRQNDFCSKCFNRRKSIIFKSECAVCKSKFEYRRRRKSQDKLCSKYCRIIFLKIQNDKNRKLINERIRIKLKGRRWLLKGKKCKQCLVEFCNLKTESDYCGEECRKAKMNSIFTSEEHRIKMSKSLKGKTGGLRDGGGHTRVYNYVNKMGENMKLNKSEIELAKCLDNLDLNWKRNKLGFGYVDLKGRYRKYYPDFYIKNFDIYLEYKGFLTEDMNHKMKDSVDRNKFNLLIVYSNDKRYRNLGLNLKQVVENNFTLLESLQMHKK